MGNILVVKSDEYILISEDGKRLLANKNHNLFNILKDKTNEEIRQWYITLRKGGELSGFS